jgi:hypothetical protein
VTEREELCLLVSRLVQVCAGRDLAEQVGWDEEYEFLLELQERLQDRVNEIVNPWCVGVPERGADGVAT